MNPYRSGNFIIAFALTLILFLSSAGCRKKKKLYPPPQDTATSSGTSTDTSTATGSDTNTITASSTALIVLFDSQLQSEKISVKANEDIDNDGDADLRIVWYYSSDNKTCIYYDCENTSEIARISSTPDCVNVTPVMAETRPGIRTPVNLDNDAAIEVAIPYVKGYLALVNIYEAPAFNLEYTVEFLNGWYLDNIFNFELTIGDINADGVYEIGGLLEGQQVITPIYVQKVFRFNNGFEEVFAGGDAGATVHMDKDVNGDGVADLILYKSWSGNFRAFEGVAYTEIFNLSLNNASSSFALKKTAPGLFTPVDVDGDLQNEFVVSAYRKLSNEAEILIYDAATCTLEDSRVVEYIPMVSEDMGAHLMDFDCNGIFEIVMFWNGIIPLSSPSQRVPRALVLDRYFQVLYNSGDTGGTISVEPGMDFNQDGVPDISIYNKIYNAQCAHSIYSGVDFSELISFSADNGFVGLTFAESRTGVLTPVDVDFDGTGEFVLKNSQYVPLSNASTSLFDAGTLQFQEDIATLPSGESVRISVQLSDLNGDGCYEIICSMEDDATSDERIMVFGYR